MSYILEADWQPTGIAELELAALSAVRSRDSCVVVAGPGAGKTELLAQRAAYLFQTGNCPDPYKILAISFKKDAAHNLVTRVRERCSPSQSQRFASVTFDAFTKSLVDRFITALPRIWRLESGYEIAHASNGDVQRFLNRTQARSGDASWRQEIAAIPSESFEAELVGTWRLPLDQKSPKDSTEYALIRWWIEHVRERQPASVTFTMLNRLAEVVQRANPEIRRAIRATYPFVFVDECQDTTYAQYDFLASVFNHREVKLTAVGDEKQRIMGWAGAKDDVFGNLETDYSAQRIQLRCNYRSSAELVRIQQVFARRLDESTIDTESRALVTQPLVRDSSQMWVFDTEVKESEHIAEWIHGDMMTHKYSIRDYALLVRQTAERFDSHLAPRLNAKGLKIRNENKRVGKSTVQDILAEPITWLFQALMRLATRERDAKAWSSAEKTVFLLRGVDTDSDGNQGLFRRIEHQLASFVANLRDQLSVAQLTPNGCVSVVDSVMRFADRASIAEVFPEYRYGDSLILAIESLEAHFVDSAKQASSWQEALDIFDGIDCIPLMTVHKSKGLEFDTVIFVGLDDKMWWSYSAEDLEGLATFFVALSRAKKRVYFTYCRERGGRARIAELFELLQQVGVPEIVIAN